MNVLELPQEWVSRVTVVTRFDNDDIHRFFTDGEIATISSFRFPHQKAEWVAARMAAKWLACNQGLATHPRSVRVSGGRQGRPALQIERGERVFLSLSHTDGIGGAAIDRGSIGIDVQRVRSLPDRSWKFFLQEKEIAALRALSIDDVAIHLWAAKEAAWKALRGENQRGLKNVTLTLSVEDRDGMRFRYQSGSEGGNVETRRLDTLVVALAER